MSVWCQSTSGFLPCLFSEALHYFQVCTADVTETLNSIGSFPTELLLVLFVVIILNFAI